MPTMWRKAMLYLGLAPDDEYDDGQHVQSARVPPVPPIEVEPDDERAAVRPISTEAAREAGVRTIERPGPQSVPPAESGGAVAGEHGTASVRTFPGARSKPHVVSPRSFNDAQQLADRFMSSQPVILNIQATDLDLSRRLIDFSSGLCYGLSGQMEKVNDRVYLLTPEDTEVSDEERRRLQQRGLHR